VIVTDVQKSDFASCRIVRRRGTIEGRGFTRGPAAFEGSTMLRFALFISLSVTATAAPIPIAKVKDAVAIQGKWNVLELLRDGKPDKEGSEGVVVTIGKDTFTVKEPKEESEDVMVYKLDEDKKHIDFAAMQPVMVQDMNGLYELDGDTLRMAFGTGDESVRPKVLKGGPGVVFFKLQRIKEVKK